MLKIELTNTNTIRIGKLETSSMQRYMKTNTQPAWESFVRHVLTANDIKIPKGMSKKEKHQLYAKQLGRSPTKFYKHFNGLQFKVFVGDNLPLVKKLCVGHRGLINTQKLSYFNKAKDKIIQAVEDGLVHLTPLIMEYNETPKELKKRYGNSAWKNITTNSFSRNKLVANVPESYCSFKSKTLKIVGKLGWYSPEVLLGVENATKGVPIKRWNEYRGITNIVYDTKQMLDKLGEKYNPEWSLRRVKEEHERASHELAKRMYPATPFVFDENIVRSVSVGEYTATLLDSPLKMKEEGNAMRHCVASYVDYVKDGGYLVYGIRNQKGERTSTFGVRVEERLTHKEYKFSQHYGFGNNIVKNSDEKLLANKILDTLRDSSNE